MSRCRQVSREPDCFFCPRVPPSPGTPPVFGVNPNLGWDGSAYSRTRLGGDCYTEFTPIVSSAMAIGLSTERTTHDPTTILHGVIFQTFNGLLFYAVVENRRVITELAPATPGVRWRIERFRNEARIIAGGLPVHIAPAATSDSLVVVACLHSIGDQVP